MAKKKDLEEKIKNIPYLSRIKRLAGFYKVETYLVGGFLRDLLLKGEHTKLDFDFAVEKKAVEFAKEFAKNSNGKVVVLDKVLRNIRVVIKKKNKFLNYDFAKFRDKDLKGDLEKRDFTINTLTVDIKKYPRLKIKDHCDGLEDLRKKRIRCVSKNSFKDDPLRILRAFSLQALYNLKITKDTEVLIKKHRTKLKRVAPERITEELFKVFSASKSYKTVNKMDELGVLERLFTQIKKAKGVNQGGYHHLDVWKHSLESLRCFENLYTRKLKKHPEIVSYLEEKVGQNRSRYQLIKFSCLFHDIGKPKAKLRKDKRTLFYGHERIGRDITEKICNKLRLSVKETAFIKKLIFMHLRPGYLADTKHPTPKAVYRYFRDANQEAVAVLLLSLSDWRATRGPLTSEKRRRSHEKIMISLVDEYFARKKKKPLKKLVSGNDIMKKLKIEPSPLVGKILNQIREQQELDKIKTKKQALKLASEVYTKEK